MSKKRKNTPEELEQQKIAEILDEHQLDEKDRALIKWRIQYPGITHEKLAALVGINKLTVTRRLNKPAFKQVWKEILLPSEELLKSKGPELLREYFELAKDPDPWLRERVISKLLISLGLLRNKVDLSAEGFEPLTVVMPMAGQQITVSMKAGPSGQSQEHGEVPGVRLLQPENATGESGEVGGVPEVPSAGGDDERG